MFELIKVGENTYYLKNATNIGIYKVNEKDIWLIDAGNDKEAGKKILKVVEEQGWNVVGIINTHSNADHIGGDKIIQDKTHCMILNYKIENAFTKYPILETSFLYGGYPFKDLTHKFLMASAPEDTEEINNNLPLGLEIIELPGHYFNQIGIKTSDNIYFLGDSLFSEELINKYHVFFIYDVKEYLNSLSKLSLLSGKSYIPSHVDKTYNIKNLIEINKKNINDIIAFIQKICEKPVTFEQILKQVFDNYNLEMNAYQYVLIGSTIKSYLSYLFNEEKILYDFNDNEMHWYVKNL